MASQLEGRLVGVRHESRSRLGGPFAARAVALRLRLFGTEAELTDRLRARAQALELPGLPKSGLPTEAVTRGPVAWSIKRHPLIAPEGEPREERVELSWRRTPPTPPERAKCKKPPSLTPPTALPRWLQRWSARGTARRLVYAEIQRGFGEGSKSTLRVHFRNGEAHDENVGFLTTYARKAGFALVEGEGNTQRWRHPDGATMRFAPYPDPELQIGCIPAGPVLEVIHQAPRPAPDARAG